MNNPEDIVRNFTYDPTGTDPAPPFPEPQELPRDSVRELLLSIARGLLYVAAIGALAALVVMVREHRP